MEIPPDTLKRYTTPAPDAPRNEWEAKLQPFHKRLNTASAIAKYGKFTYGRLGKHLKGKTDLELMRLYNECDKAKSFGGLFVHKIKNKP